MVVFDALGVSFKSPIVLPFVLVLSYAITILPLSTGGIGITEAMSTIVLVAFGVPVQAASVGIFVDRFIGVYAPSMLGWVFFIRMDVSDGANDGSEGKMDVAPVEESDE
jgi:uncharacterized membrane protein YbhN (UPF0104 family)